MSIQGALRAVLVDDATVKAITTTVRPQFLFEGDQPAVTYTRTGGEPVETQTTTGGQFGRHQFTIRAWAITELACETLAQACFNAVDHYSGTKASTAIQMMVPTSIMRDVINLSPTSNQLRFKGQEFDVDVWPETT